MNSFKIITSVASAIIILLLIALSALKTTQTQPYNDTIKALMVNHKLSSQQEALDYFPELSDVKNKMEQVANLKRDIQSIYRNPNFNFSEDHLSKVKGISKRINELNLSIEKDLTLLIAKSKTEKKQQETKYTFK